MVGRYKSTRYLGTRQEGEGVRSLPRANQKTVLGGAAQVRQPRDDLWVLAPKIGRSQAVLGLVRPPAPRKRVNEFLDARLQDAAKRNEQRRAGSLLLRRTVLVLVLALAILAPSAALRLWQVE